MRKGILFENPFWTGVEMEEEIRFDASKYPSYQEAMKDHLRFAKKITMLSGIVAIVIVIAILIAYSHGNLPIIFPLLGSFAVLVPWIFMAVWLPKLLKRSYEQKPLRITDEGIIFRGMKIPFNRFDRLIRTEKITRGIKPDISISFVKGSKRVIISIRVKTFGNLDEFLRVLKQLHPEIQIDLDESKK